MQEWMDQNFAIFFPFYFAALWILVTYWIALTGGWRLLAKRFRFQGVFAGAKWSIQSARMRMTTRYSNALTIGADMTGLYIAPVFFFRAWHPPLFIPWVEITAVRKTQLFFFEFVELRLGRSEEVPFRINARLAARIEAAAGSGWPMSYERAAQLPPPPIG